MLELRRSTRILSRLDISMCGFDPRMLAPALLAKSVCLPRVYYMLRDVCSNWVLYSVSLPDIWHHFLFETILRIGQLRWICFESFYRNFSIVRTDRADSFLSWKWASINPDSKLQYLVSVIYARPWALGQLYSDKNKNLPIWAHILYYIRRQ